VIRIESQIIKGSDDLMIALLSPVCETEAGLIDE
jgi:hypothetical protein